MSGVRSGVTLIRVGRSSNTNTKTNGSNDASLNNSSDDIPLNVSSNNNASQKDTAESIRVSGTSSDAPQLIARNPRKMSGIGELQIAKPAPSFEANAVVDSDFKTVKLADYRGRYLVLFFYPLDFTFVCPTEIIAFSDRVEEFRAINCEVIACSTDSVYSHLAWVNTPRKQGGLGAMNIPLLADKTMEISKKYGCLKEDEGVAFRGLYIIDDKGTLRQATINDLPVGRSVDETLRLVQAFQFTDKHGEVCPAGWRPGKETVKPDPKLSQVFFDKENK
ncbi:hypothetical protein EGW08_016521 [Elysia chlorotica]|uniref:Thioredoxin peroxidase n=1 Tax=Elysia chlorotica TaxID=188477 RepID=A0A3S1BVA3_ELYCH|nr:hypothetical protein EGW08_016521 [Elysia chlorotica]